MRSFGALAMALEAGADEEADAGTAPVRGPCRSRSVTRSVTVAGSPLLFVAVSQPDGHAVHEKQDDHQDDDRARRALHERAIRVLRPDEDLDGQGGELRVEPLG